MLWKRIGIDMGTATLVIYVKGDGVVLNEPALLASDPSGLRMLAVGSSARELLRRQPDSLRAVKPLRDATITDYRAAAMLLQHSIARVCGRQRIFRPDVMLAVPSGVTGVERRAVLEATMQAGARTAYLIEKPRASALGANLPISTAHGVAICHLGAGATEVAVISAGDIVAAEWLRTGGAHLDAAVAAAVKARHGIDIDEQEAERVKIGLGSAVPPQGSAAMDATSSRSGNGRVTVTANEVYAAIADAVDSISAMVGRVWAQTPADVQRAVRPQGIMLTGGGARLRGWAPLLSQRTGLPVQVAAQPEACAAVGAGLALENLQVIKGAQHYIT